MADTLPGIVEKPYTLTSGAIEFETLAGGVEEPQTLAGRVKSHTLGGHWCDTHTNAAGRIGVSNLKTKKQSSLRDRIFILIRLWCSILSCN